MEQKPQGNEVKRCKRCGRPLKTEWSTARGIGRRCRRKLAHEEWLWNQLTIFDFIPDPDATNN